LRLTAAVDLSGVAGRGDVTALEIFLVGGIFLHGTRKSFRLTEPQEIFHYRSKKNWEADI
jgi:hypothetical protein